jgi:hypothetical protein
LEQCIRFDFTLLHFPLGFCIAARNTRRAITQQQHKVYNDWYNQYLLDAQYPRLIVRFEDLLLHTRQVVDTIATCVGAAPSSSSSAFSYQINSAKSHGSGTGYVKAIFKTGDHAARVKSLTLDDVAYAGHHLDANLMQVFHYPLAKHTNPPQ